MVLIFGKQKKRSKPQGNPPWLTWSVTLLIAYMMFNHYTDKKNQAALAEKQPSATETPIVAPEKNTQENEKKEADSTLKVVEPTITEEIAAPVAPTLPVGVTINGDIAGHGEVAQCGQEMLLTIDTLFPEESGHTNEKNKEMRVRSGIAQDMPWVVALEGMKIGGVRQINMPAELAVDKTALTETLTANDVVQYKVELQQLLPALPPEQQPYYMMEVAQGKDTPATCGQAVAFHLTLWGRDGTPLYQSNKEKEASPLEATIGAGDYFYGLDKTLLGMQEGGKRFVVVPPSYGALNGEKNPALKKYVAPKQTVLMEVELVDIK